MHGEHIAMCISPSQVVAHPLCPCPTPYGVSDPPLVVSLVSPHSPLVSKCPLCPLWPYHVMGCMWCQVVLPPPRLLSPCVPMPP